MLKYKGFTLFELVISLGLLAILASLTMPLMVELTSYYRRQVAEQRLLSALNAARSAALNQFQYVILCPSKDKKTCSDDWQQDLLLFIDVDASRQVDVKNKLLHVYPKFSYGTLQLNAFPNHHYFRFAGNGFSSDQNGTFYFCYKNKGWKIIINRLGRARIEENLRCAV